MRALLNFSERREVQGLIGRVTESRSVQGVVMDYDPLWLALWHLRSKYGEKAVDRLSRRLFDWLHFFPAVYWPTSLLRLLEDVNLELGESEPPDPNWLPNAWLELQDTLGFSSPSKEPFVAKVCLLPWQPEERLPEVGEYPFRVIQERRAPAELSLPMRAHRPVVGGVSIGTKTSNSGTLGGIVEDQHKKRYGVTCAHVVGGVTAVEQPAQCDNAAAASLIGKAQIISRLNRSARSTPCNPYNQNSLMNVVDAALIEFDAATKSSLHILNQANLAGVTAKKDINPGQLVEMIGKQSGSRLLEVGGLGVTYRMRDSDSNFFCFHHVFELRWPRWWRAFTSRPVQRGDSGAWLLASGINGNEWAGMAFAGDRLIGYAIFADDVLAWAKRDYKLDLVVA